MKNHGVLRGGFSPAFFDDYAERKEVRDEWKAVMVRAEVHITYGRCRR